MEGGVQVEGRHCVKGLPVGFGVFNGNAAVHLSTGKASAVCGKILGDDDLLQIAREQLYWTVGKNPFGQSLIYGEGHNYPQMDSFSSGEITGEMPGGIRTLNDDDSPYWPQTNNACYKEVWVTTAGKWLSLLSEFQEQLLQENEEDGEHKADERRDVVPVILSFATICTKKSLSAAQPGDHACPWLTSWMSMSDGTLPGFRSQRRRR